MSIEQWSIIYFVASCLYYMTIFISLFTMLNLLKIFSVILAFLVQLAVTLAYGINTNQIGLVLVSIVQVLMVILIFIQYGRLINENQDS